jgi:hypothetical protein
MLAVLTYCPGADRGARSDPGRTAIIRSTGEAPR